MKPSQFVDDESLKQLHDQGWCIKCVTKYLANDGELRVLDMCDKCKSLVMSQILKGD